MVPRFGPAATIGKNSVEILSPPGQIQEYPRRIGLSDLLHLMMGMIQHLSTRLLKENCLDTEDPGSGVLLVLHGVVSHRARAAADALTPGTPPTPSPGLPAETLPRDLRNLPLGQNALQDRPV
jgi:hypothetical protein